MILEKKVTAKELGEGLVFLDGRCAQSDADALKEYPGFDGSFDTTKISDEMVFLRVFTFDAAVSMSFDNEKRGAVLDVYHGYWKKALNEHSPSTDEDGAAIFAMMQQRLVAYTEALKTPHEQGPAYAVGGKFAELCGHPKDAAVARFGGLLFAGTYDCVSGCIKSFKVG